jgi:hypothetical protein
MQYLDFMKAMLADRYPYRMVTKDTPDVNEVV